MLRGLPNRARQNATVRLCALSLRTRRHAPIAQLVEHVIRNDEGRLFDSVSSTIFLPRRPPQGDRQGLSQDRHRLLLTLRLGRLCTNKMPLTAVHLLNTDVVPFFEAQGIPIETVLSDNGQEFRGEFLHADQLGHRPAGCLEWDCRLRPNIEKEKTKLFKPIATKWSSLANGGLGGECGSIASSVRRSSSP